MIFELERLKAENKELKQRLADAEGKISYYVTHATLFEGVRGETLISQLVGGKITAYGESHDVEVVGKDSARIEVKMASLNVPVQGAKTLRWVWSKILGESGNKDYDWLILVGKKDERYLNDYLDRESPFVFFLIQKSEVEALTTAQGRYKAIYLTTNPNKAKQSKAGVLYDRYMVSSKDLTDKLGL